MTNFRHLNGSEFVRKNPEIRKLETSRGFPIPLAEIKEDLRVDSDDEDGTVLRMARFAASFFERRTGCAALAGRYEVSFPDWPLTGIWEVLRWPFRELEGVTYLKAATPRPIRVDADIDQFYAESGARSFMLQPLSSFERVNLFSSPSAVKVLFTAGYDTEAISGTSGEQDNFAPQSEERPIDDGVRGALQMLIGHFYENRELFAADKIAEVEASAGSILAAYRQFW